MKTIYHIVERESWDLQKNSAEYVHPSLAIEGFIHTSDEHQVQGVLERYYSEKKELLKLSIDTSKLQKELIYEEATNGEKFPHIYGAINKDAVYKIEEL